MCYKKPGPRCSKHAEERLLTALASGNEQAIQEAKEEFALTPRGIALLERAGDMEKAAHFRKRRDAMIAEYTRERDLDQVWEDVQARFGEEHQTLTALAEQTRLEHARLKEEYEAAKSDPDVTEAMKIQMSRNLREAYYARREASDNAFAYRRETAQLIASLSNKGVDLTSTFEGDRLGNLVPVGTSDTHSREWYQMRQKGIGGSDVGKILKVDPEYGRSDYESVFNSKLVDYTAMSDEEVAASGSDPENGVEDAKDRGDAWEPIIRTMFAARNPQFEVQTSDTTWTNPDKDWQRVNVDSVLVDSETKQPVGVLECKTSMRPEDWENGVPPGYRAQVLHYLEASGLDFGYVAVSINDSEYRQYRIDRGEAITPSVGTVAENEPKLLAFMEKVRVAREGADIAVGGNGNSTFNNRDGKRRGDALIAAMSGRDLAEVKAAVDAREGSYDKRVREEFAASEVGNRDFVVVDLETTSFSPSSGEIIEIAWQRRASDGSIKESGHERYSPDPRALRSGGTGASELHGITPEDVKGLPRFTDPESQERLRGIFDDAVVVAHNATFENRFLQQDMDGYFENKPVMLDTMSISKHFFNTRDNTLSTFVEANGVAYENAHRADHDVNMTAEALFKFFANRDREAGSRQ